LILVIYLIIRRQDMRSGQKVIISNAKGRVHVSKRVKTEDGYGWRKEPDGTESFSYDVILDEDALATMARRAARNTTGRSKAGALEVKILSRSRP
jgi:hypothetical protein